MEETREKAAGAALPAGGRGGAPRLPRAGAPRAPLTWAEAEPLFKRLAALDPAADAEERDWIRNFLIEGHRPLALAAAARLFRAGTAHGEPREDLEQVAMVGMVSAVDRFDPAAGVRFSTFAVATVFGHVARHLRDRVSAVRLTRSHQELAAEAGRAAETLRALLGRSPTWAEIAGHLGAAEEAVLTAVAGVEAVRARSLDAPLAPAGRGGGGADGEVSFWEVLGGNDPALTAITAHGDLYEALQRLPAPERRVLLLRFAGDGGELSQRAVAARLGTNQMQVSRLERRALARLRAVLRVPKGGGV